MCVCACSCRPTQHNTTAAQIKQWTSNQPGLLRQPPRHHLHAWLSLTVLSQHQCSPSFRLGLVLFRFILFVSPSLPCVSCVQCVPILSLFCHQCQAKRQYRDCVVWRELLGNLHSLHYLRCVLLHTTNFADCVPELHFLIQGCEHVAVCCV